MTNPRAPFVFATDRPPLPPPDGRPLIAHVVINVESWPFDEPMPRAVLPPPHGVVRVPDVPNFSWVEYGLRCGLPRLMRVLGHQGVPVSAFLNAAVVDDYPRVAEAVAEAGWEVVGHGYRQRALDVESEAEVIASSLDRLERFYGTRPRGWLGPGLQETPATPDHLAAAGIRYVYDWVVDDLPTWLRTERGPLLSLPYTLELNDSVLFAVGRQASAELLSRFEATLEVLEPELESQPRVLTIALHPHLAGVPHRIGGLARILEILGDRSDTVFMVGAGMHDWYTSVDPPDGGRP